MINHKEKESLNGVIRNIMMVTGDMVFFMARVPK